MLLTIPPPLVRPLALHHEAPIETSPAAAAAEPEAAV